MEEAFCCCRITVDLKFVFNGDDKKIMHNVVNVFVFHPSHAAHTNEPANWADHQPANISAFNLQLVKSLARCDRLLTAFLSEMTHFHSHLSFCATINLHHTHTGTLRLYSRSSVTWARQRKDGRRSFNKDRTQRQLEQNTQDKNVVEWGGPCWRQKRPRKRDQFVMMNSNQRHVMVSVYIKVLLQSSFDL